MKLRGHSIEYVPEYAKDLAWEGRVSGATQIELLMNQYLRMERLCRRRQAPTGQNVSKPDYIVTDSPLLLGLVYGKTAPGYLPPSWNQFLKELHFSFERSINVFLTGSKSYNQDGRAHTESAAKIIHECIKQMLDREGIHAYHLNYAQDTPEEIYKILDDIEQTEYAVHSVYQVLGNDGLREAQGR
jgi:hypothetical protein